MYNIIISLSLIFNSYSDTELIHLLDHQNFKVRIISYDLLNKRLSWPLAIKLEFMGGSYERNKSIKRLVRAYWDNSYPHRYQDLPYLDSLDEYPCGMKNGQYVYNTNHNSFVQYYLDIVRDQENKFELDYTVYAPEFKMCTRLFLNDLVKLRIPPIIIKPLLKYMQYHSDIYSAWRKKNQPEMMEIP